MRDRAEGGSRLKEILSILARHQAARGLTPERLRAIVEDLGPTFVKLGQIMSMRRDMLPDAYCRELEKLRADVAPMPLSQVKNVIEAEYQRPPEEVFSSFGEIPLGSASIAQVHAAALLDGRPVVVKVQRPHIRETMSRDIQLLHKAAGILNLTDLGGVVDLDMVLDELWATAQQEMDFLSEARNADEFRALNRDVKFFGCPVIEHECTTGRVLVMEYVDGLPIDGRDALMQAGYDLSEIGRKLADNYVKQVIDDGFFHADPHPGNLRIRDGKIVWLDLGMMGRLSKRDQALLRDAVKAFAENDVDGLRDVVLALGVCREAVDRDRLYADLDGLMAKYGKMALGRMDLGVMMDEFLSLAKSHHISMPGGITLLGRGMVTLEGTLAALSPELDLMQILKERMKSELAASFDWKTALEGELRTLLTSGRKTAELPGQASDLLRTALKGQAKLSVTLLGGEKRAQSAARATDRLIRALLCCALLLGGCLLCLSGLSPAPLGVPVPAWICFSLSAVLGGQLLWTMRRRK